MSDQAFILATSATAASIAFFHTITGPDHYLPFIMIGRARNWSAFKTAMLTLACGFGHVFSSIILAMICIWFGSILTGIEWLEEFRGNIADWLLIAFGFAYMVWGLKWLLKSKKHTHYHVHTSGEVHDHTHSHMTSHSHVHAKDSKNITPWVLFIIFVLGPCEPLIPLMMAPASKGSLLGAFVVAGIFSAITLATMLALVMSSLSGLKMISLNKAEKYTHAIAGASILCCGLAIQVLGL